MAFSKFRNQQLKTVAARTWKGNNSGSAGALTDNAAGSFGESTSSVLTITGGSNSVLNDILIQVKQASTSQAGYLGATDWNTFNNKQPELVSGSNIKTINGSSILGPGNLVISGGSVAWGSVTGTLSDQTDLQSALNAKQATITFGTGVQTALGVNVGSAGAPVVNGGALGTPSSGTATNLTGLPLASGVTGTLPIANGGTNATTASAARTELGLAIGTDVQAYLLSLAEIGAQTITTESTTARTLALTDANDYIRCTNASATTITVPTNASVAFPIGTQIDVFQAGTGQVSFVAAGGVTINRAEGLKIAAQYKAATLKKIGTDEWDLLGAIAA